VSCQPSPEEAATARWHGHDYDIICPVTNLNEPELLICQRCGRTWDITCRRDDADAEVEP